MSEEELVSGRTQPDDVDCAKAISSLSLRPRMGTPALDELPPELIFMICSFLRPIWPMHEVFANRATYDFGTVYDTLQHDWRTVENLSVTNRRLRRRIADSGCLYRTVIVKGHSFRRVVSLLWRLEKNPAIGPAVRMIYMGLAFEVYPKEDSMPPQQYHLDFVLKMARACNVQYPAALSSSTAPVPSDDLQCEWTSLLARVIVAKMTNIEDIGMKIVSRVFRGMEPPSTSFFKGLSLPNLRSVAVRLEDSINWHLIYPGGGVLICHDTDLVMDLSPIRNFYVEAEGLLLYMKLSHSHFSAPKFKNLTTITLNGCPVNERELARMLDHCTLVSVFRYIMSDNSVLAIAPGIVVQALQRRHAKSLRTLCIHVFNRIWGSGEISTLASFNNLESLWIDLGSIDNSNTLHGLVVDETANGNHPSWYDPQPNHFFFTLPHTLKRTFFYGVSRGQENSVDWLISNQGGLSFPELEEIALHCAINDTVDRVGSNFSHGASRHTYIRSSVWQ